MGKHKTKLALPEWYNLNKYEKTKELTLAGWYEQFHIRYMCQKLLQIKALQSSFDKNFFEALNLIRNNPIVDITSNPLLQRFFDSPTMAELREKRPHHSFGIKSLTVRNLYGMENNIEKTKRDQARNYFEEVSNYAGRGFYNPSHKYQEWFDDPVSSVLENPLSSGANIRIDLNLTDKNILEELKKRLPKLREEAGTNPLKGKSRRAMDLEDLTKFAVLPYLDLQIWAQEKGISIPKRIIAGAIYPNDERGENDIKTTVKLAKQILTINNLSNHAAQAATEIYQSS